MDGWYKTLFLIKEILYLISDFQCFLYNWFSLVNGSFKNGTSIQIIFSYKRIFKIYLIVNIVSDGVLF